MNSKKTKKKKAALFSILALMLAGLIFLIAIPSTDTPIQKNTEISKTRIKTIDGFLDNTNSYYKTVLRIVGPATMDSLTQNIVRHDYLNSSQLQCDFEKILSQGKIMNFSQTPQNFDLAFIIDGGVMNSYESTLTPAGSPDYPYIQKFISRNKTLIKKMTVFLGYFYIIPRTCNIKAYVFDQLCGEPGKVLGVVNTTQTFSGSGYFNATLNFSTQIPVERGETLYYVLDSNCSGLAGPNGLFPYTIDSKTINESNMSIAEMSEQNFSQTNSIDYYSSLLSEYAEKNYNAELVNKINNAKVFQEEPWNLNIVLNITTYLRDADASWEKNALLSQKISILGMDDPLFAKGTNGNQNRTITRNPDQIGIWDLKINTSQGNITAFTIFYNQSHYITSSRAPSFLMRYSNNPNSSAFGITSLVNISYPERQNASYLDYYYFSDINFSCSLGQLYNITEDPTGLFGHFKLDKESLAYFGYGSTDDGNFSEYTC